MKENPVPSLTVKVLKTPDCGDRSPTCPGQAGGLPYWRLQRSGNSDERGFTLLEMMVATLIMGIAVVGLLSQLSTSMRTASRLIDYDRAAVLARKTMDEILLNREAPKFDAFEGNYPESATGGTPAGWRARITPFEQPPAAGPGTPILERVELEVWWGQESARRSIKLEGFRQAKLPAPPAGGAQQ